jgi:hypothetical protein
MSLSSFLKAISHFFGKLFGSGGETTPRGTTFLTCPNSTQIQETVTITREGGAVKVAEHVLTVPPGAVGEEVRFTATLLADKTLKLKLQASGKDTYQFLQPAMLALSFGRCEAPADPSRLRIYKIDEKGTVIQDLGGEVNRENRTVTATLKTLSIYTMGLP